jgi:hypothetical protein
MNKIKRMVCESCNRKADFLLQDKTSMDSFHVNKNGVITGGEAISFPLRKNIFSLSPAIQKKIEVVGGVCTYCEDETTLRVVFENGSILNDREAWKYFLAPTSAAVNKMTIKELKLGEIYRDHNTHPKRLSLNRVIEIKSNSYHYNEVCIDLETCIVHFYHKNLFNTTKQLRYLEMVLATTYEKHVMEYIENVICREVDDGIEPIVVLENTLLKEIQIGVSKN